MYIAAKIHLRPLRRWLQCRCPGSSLAKSHRNSRQARRPHLAPRIALLGQDPCLTVRLCTCNISVELLARCYCRRDRIANTYSAVWLVALGLGEHLQTLGLAAVATLDFDDPLAVARVTLDDVTSVILDCHPRVVELCLGEAVVSFIFVTSGAFQPTPVSTMYSFSTSPEGVWVKWANDGLEFTYFGGRGTPLSLFSI